MKKLILSLFLCLISFAGNCQTEFPPDVQWGTMMNPPRRPNWGTNYIWNGDIPATYTPSPVTAGIEQTAEESGEDWWYSHCNIYDSTGVQIGYAAAGYAGYVNWSYQDSTDCFGGIIGNEFIGEQWNPVSPVELETRARRKGSIRCWVGMFGMDGEKLWCRNYLGGVFYGVAQDADGNIVAVGEASTNRMSTSTQNNFPVMYNGLTDISDYDCSNGLGHLRTKMAISKINLQGSALWHGLYSMKQDVVDGWSFGMVGRSIKPININGNSGFYIVGSTQVEGSTREHMFGMRLLSDGTVYDSHTFLFSDPAVLEVNPDSLFMRPLDVEIVEHEGIQKALITGFFRGGSLDRTDAFMFYLDDIDSNPWSVAMTQNTNSIELQPFHETDLHQYSSGIAFAVEDNDLSIIWPVLSDYDPTTQVYAGRNIAHLRVHKFSATDRNIAWTTDLGEVRAYDLQADAIQMSNGNIAVVSSKWATPDYNFYSLPENVQNSLTDPDGLGFIFTVWDGQRYGWETSNVFDYWNTDAYVATLNSGTGSLIWETTIDSEPGVLAQPFPGNLKKQECMYRITQADDGGLVICGNTGNNFDDAYIVKLQAQTTPIPVDTTLMVDLQVSAYPNPAQSVVNVKYNSKSESNIVVYDSNGKKVYSKLLTNREGSFPISIETWASGIYTICLSNDKSTSLVRISRI